MRRSCFLIPIKWGMRKSNLALLLKYSCLYPEELLKANAEAKIKGILQVAEEMRAFWVLLILCVPVNEALHEIYHGALHEIYHGL